MEEIITKTIISPRVSLKKNSKGIGWEIASSSKDDLEEIKGIIEIIEETDKLMIEKFKSKK